MSLELLCLDVKDGTPQLGHIGSLAGEASAAESRDTPKTETEIFDEMLSRGVKLNHTELDVFSRLYNSSPERVQYETIAESVWTDSNHETMHTLYVNVNRIRRKIRQAGVQDVFVITNTYGLGYWLTVTENAKRAVTSECGLENLCVKNTAEAEESPSDEKPLHEAGSMEELCQILGVGYSKPSQAAKALWALIRRNGRTVGRYELVSEVWDEKVETSQQFGLHESSLRQILWLARGLIEGVHTGGFKYEILHYREIGYRIHITRAHNPQAQPRSEAR
ncbi:MAG TPA: helix-turn-helix domain-containing protein [Candidatus Nanoarchaeia archaeon]|nr:helix-turn-helix domain-containing protein [Candidatus Nanoarchaeia archaeon]